MNRNERSDEQEAVRTTIVGGRPPGSGKAIGPIPRGIEVLVKKAAIDRDFRQTLLAKRATAGDEIGLKLKPAEIAMLNAVPAVQLDAIIANTSVPDITRAAFLGRAAAVMLAALGASTVGARESEIPPSKGIEPDQPEPKPDIEELIKLLVKDLSNPDKEKRLAARNVLFGLGPRILPLLQEVKAPDETARKELDEIIKALRAKPEAESGSEPRDERVSKGIRPDRLSRTLGIQPDRPE